MLVLVLVLVLVLAGFRTITTRECNFILKEPCTQGELGRWEGEGASRHIGEHGGACFLQYALYVLHRHACEARYSRHLRGA